LTDFCIVAIAIGMSFLQPNLRVLISDSLEHALFGILFLYNSIVVSNLIQNGKEKICSKLRESITIEDMIANNLLYNSLMQKEVGEVVLSFSYQVFCAIMFCQF
jgi:hypothetical protein